VALERAKRIALFFTNMVRWIVAKIWLPLVLPNRWRGFFLIAGLPSANAKLLNFRGKLTGKNYDSRTPPPSRQSDAPSASGQKCGWFGGLVSPFETPATRCIVELRRIPSQASWQRGTKAGGQARARHRAAGPGAQERVRFREAEDRIPTPRMDGIHRRSGRSYSLAGPAAEDNDFSLVENQRTSP